MRGKTRKTRTTRRRETIDFLDFFSEKLYGEGLESCSRAGHVYIRNVVAFRSFYGRDAMFISVAVSLEVERSVEEDVT